jgi:hypothetical protein
MKRIFLILSVLAFTGILSFVFVPKGQSDPSWPFGNVTATELAQHQLVTLTPAIAPADAATSGPAAISAAEAFQGAKALTEQYMHCSDTSMTPALDEDCWVVSIDPTGMTDPSGGPAPAASGQQQALSPAPLQYDLVLVDPATGKVIEALL